MKAKILILFSFLVLLISCSKKETFQNKTFNVIDIKVDEELFKKELKKENAGLVKDEELVSFFTELTSELMKSLKDEYKYVKFYDNYAIALNSNYIVLDTILKDFKINKEEENKYYIYNSGGEEVVMELSNPDKNEWRLILGPMVMVLNESSKDITPKQGEKSGLSTKDIQSSADILAEHIIKLIHNKEYEKIADYFHPEKGCAFVLYGYYDKNTTPVLSKEDFIKAIKENKIITWGNDDATGEPIKLSVSDFFQKILYKVNYVDIEPVIGDIPISGNMKNNLEKVFADAVPIVYKYSGSQDFGGMDASSIILLFEKYNGKYYLIAISNTEWTI